MELRWGSAADTAALAQVFYRAVRMGPSPYSEAQRVAWMSAPPDAATFATRLASCHIAVGYNVDGPVGFMAMTDSGYIDLVFIEPEARGRGLFRKLYDMIEARAREDGISRLWAHASLAAEPAFAAVGFSVIQRQTVERAGVALPRAEMEKLLE